MFPPRVSTIDLLLHKVPAYEILLTSFSSPFRCIVIHKLVESPERGSEVRSEEDQLKATELMLYYKSRSYCLLITAVRRHCTDWYEI